jgi:hypothetical protein
MAMQAETRIGDVRVEVSKLPPTQALVLSARIAKIIAPAIAAGMKGGVTSILNADISGIVSVLFDRIDPKELPGLLRDMLSATLLDGKPANEVFDVLFADKLELIIPLVKFLLGFQFGNFGRAMLAAGGAMMTQAALSESPSISKTN